MAGQPIELRDYQVETINKFLENPQCIQEIATGAGKTIITATLCKLVRTMEEH
jgi:superfamily II DNA or RNA helicase